MRNHVLDSFLARSSYKMPRAHIIIMALETKASESIELVLLVAVLARLAN